MHAHVQAGRLLARARTPRGFLSTYSSTPGDNVLRKVNCQLVLGKLREKPCCYCSCSFVRQMSLCVQRYHFFNNTVCTCYFPLATTLRFQFRLFLGFGKDGKRQCSYHNFFTIHLPGIDYQFLFFYRSTLQRNEMYQIEFE